MNKQFIFRLIAVAFCLQAFLAYGKSPERHEGEPHLDLAPPQFEQHLSHVFSLLDSKKFEEAISYSNSVENLPEEWKEYLVANTHYEIIIPEEKCFEHSKKTARNKKLPNLIRSRLYVMALNCRYLYSKDNDDLFDEIFSFKNIDPGYLKIVLESFRYSHIDAIWSYRIQKRGNTTDISHNVVHSGTEHYYYIMSSFRVSEDGSVYDIDIVKSWPEVDDQNRLTKHMDFNRIQHSANPGDRVIVFFLFTPFTSS
ncbi:MAG: hypothetical protein CL539_10800 [Alcanivorax sp.]|nr:hypothetical protein [Alcanivorax sp.]